MGETKELLDCGTSGTLGLMTSRGGLWCLQARRFDGSIDKMMLQGENGVPVYLKDEARRAQEEAERSVNAAKRAYDDAQNRLREASERVKETQGSPAVAPASK
jgi:hypothetical protein